METILFNPGKTYTDSEYEIIRLCALNGISIKETSIILEIDFDDFLMEYNKINSNVRKKYDSGALESRLSLNQKISALAKNGSSAAQESMKKILSEQDIKNFMLKLDD